MPDVKPPNTFNPAFGFDKETNKGDSGPSTPLETAYETWRTDQRPAQMAKLLESAKSVLDRALTSYAGGNRALAGRAKLLAIDAFKSYNPKKGTKLRTHLYIRLQPLQREFTKRTSPLAIPERVQLDMLRINQTEQSMRELNGRDAADDEIADELGLSTRRIAHVRKFSKGLVSESQMVSPEGSPMQPATHQVTPEDIWTEYVHHDLGPVDKKIFEWKTGIYGKQVLTTNEIARRLGITPSAVSQRAAKIALLLEQTQNE
jgi:DNA-directed RNA polymerase specialized sigma subunit